MKPFGGAVVKGGQNLPPIVEIELTDLPSLEGGWQWPPLPPSPTVPASPCYRVHKLVESSYVWKLKFIKKLQKIRHLKKRKDDWWRQLMRPEKSLLIVTDAHRLWLITLIDDFTKFSQKKRNRRRIWYRKWKEDEPSQRPRINLHKKVLEGPFINDITISWSEMRKMYFGNII